jgi:hypothetical protein
MPDATAGLWQRMLDGNKPASMKAISWPRPHPYRTDAVQLVIQQEANGYLADVDLDRTPLDLPSIGGWIHFATGPG